MTEHRTSNVLYRLLNWTGEHDHVMLRHVAIDEIGRLHAENLTLRNVGVNQEEKIERLQQRVAELEASRRRYMDLYGKEREQTHRMMVEGHAEPPTDAPVAWCTGIEWVAHQSETVRKLTRACQPEHGFTTPLYAGVAATKPAAPATDGYDVSRAAMDVIYETLKFYANLCSYEGERTGGVLQGCPRGPQPTPAQLVVHAIATLRMIDRDVLGRTMATKSGAPAQSANGGLSLRGEPIAAQVPADEKEARYEYQQNPIGGGTLSTAVETSASKPCVICGSTVVCEHYDDGDTRGLHDADYK